jgi:hypothetical protein
MINGYNQNRLAQRRRDAGEEKVGIFFSRRREGVKKGNSMPECFFESTFASSRLGVNMVFSGFNSAPPRLCARFVFSDVQVRTDGI